MGVLDEAIKEHLELKRRRGADAGEIKREEDEALGEVRVTRGPGTRSSSAQAQQDEAPASEEHDSMHQPTEAFNPAEVAEALGQAPDEVAAEVPQIAESELAEPEPEPEPVSEETVAEDPEEVGEVDEAQATAEKQAADELEDTPEFLEDAPEHDKLWFEQKPPKDFDF